jgi:Ca2+-binding RTX toxin-like protein
VDLGTGTASGNGADTVANIENVDGTSFDDTITGNDAANKLYGGISGINTLVGEAGDDVLIDGFGADTMIGGDGTDTVDYHSAPRGLSIDLRSGSARHDGGDHVDSVENIIGSSFDDRLYGDDGVNVVLGGPGNDTIYGFGGNDTLNGQDGVDFIDGGDGADTCTGEHDFACE